MARRRSAAAIALAATLALLGAAIWLGGAGSAAHNPGALAATLTPSPTVVLPTCPSGMTNTYALYCSGPANAPAGGTSASAAGSNPGAALPPTQQCGAETIPASIACIILPASPSGGSAPAAAAPAAAPGQVVATALDATDIEVDWTYSAADAQQFVLLDANNYPAVLGAAPATARTLRLTNLMPATQYCIAVYAYNAAGYSPPSAVACATTPAS